MLAIAVEVSDAAAPRGRSSTLLLALVPPLLGGVALATIYRVMPPRRPTWRAIALPAVVGAIALVVITRVFVFVAPRVFGANLVYGTLGAILVGLTWLDLVFSVVLLGCGVGPRASRGRSRRRSPDRGQPWRVPQRRQKRAVADSDRPQLEQGWTPAGAAVRWRPERGPPVPTRPRGPRSSEPLARLAKRAMAGDSTSGRAGHCGSAERRRGGWTGPATARCRRAGADRGRSVGSEDLPGGLLDPVFARCLGGDRAGSPESGTSGTTGAAGSAARAWPRQGGLRLGDVSALGLGGTSATSGISARR